MFLSKRRRVEHAKNYFFQQIWISSYLNDLEVVLWVTPFFPKKPFITIFVGVFETCSTHAKSSLMYRVKSKFLIYVWAVWLTNKLGESSLVKCTRNSRAVAKPARQFGGAMQIFPFLMWKQSISKEMKNYNDNIWILFSMTKLSDWLHHCSRALIQF